jgi:hypothetical protein
MLVLALAVSAQAASKQWLHVHVVDNGSEGPESVKVNIPISLVEVMLPMVEEKGLENGKIRLEDKDIKVEDLRKIWNTLKEEGDSEFVSIQSKDANVKVMKQGGFLLVQTDDESKSTVDIKLPLAVVDAMLSGKGEELNLMAAVQALQDSGIKDLITVKDKEATVRVWIDDRNEVK